MADHDEHEGQADDGADYEEDDEPRLTTWIARVLLMSQLNTNLLPTSPASLIVPSCRRIIV